MDQKGKLQKPIILLLAMLLALMPAVLASCESGSNDFAEAETEVSSELEALKSGNAEVPQVADPTEGVSETMLSVDVQGSLCWNFRQIWKKWVISHFMAAAI